MPAHNPFAATATMSPPEVDVLARPEDAQRYRRSLAAAALIIHVDGKPLSLATQQSISRIAVSLGVNRQGRVVFDVDDRGLRSIDLGSGELREGRVLEVLIGAVGGDMRSVFSGTISVISVEMDEDQGVQVQVEASDALSKVAAGEIYQRHLAEASDYQLLSRIVSDKLRLTLSIDERTQLKMERLRSAARTQSGLSNQQFIAALALEFGCDYWIDNQTFYFRSEIPGRAVALLCGYNILNIVFRLDTQGQVYAVLGRGWDSANAAEVVQRTDIRDSPTYTRILSDEAHRALRESDARHHMFVSDVSWADEVAQAELRRRMRQLVTAEGCVTGNTELSVGAAVQVGGMGRFNGEYLVQSLEHSIGKNGFRTHFTLCLNL